MDSDFWLNKFQTVLIRTIVFWIRTFWNLSECTTSIVSSYQATLDNVLVRTIVSDYAAPFGAPTHSAAEFLRQMFTILELTAIAAALLCSYLYDIDMSHVLKFNWLFEWFISERLYFKYSHPEMSHSLFDVQPNPSYSYHDQFFSLGRSWLLKLILVTLSLTRSMFCL